MLNGKPKAPRPAGPELQPIRAGRKIFVGQSLAEFGVVGPEVANVDPSFWNPGGAARLEDVDRPIGVGFRDPAPDGAPTQPLVAESKRRKRRRSSNDLTSSRGSHFRETAYSSQKGHPVCGIKMPSDDLADVGIEPLTRLGNFFPEGW